jgi:ribosomal protein S8
MSKSYNPNKVIDALCREMKKYGYISSFSLEDEFDFNPRAAATFLSRYYRHFGDLKRYVVSAKDEGRAVVYAVAEEDLPADIRVVK